MEECFQAKLPLVQKTKGSTYNVEGKFNYKKYAEMNKEKVLEKAAKYRSENREILREKNKNYYDNNKPKICLKP